MRVLLFVKGVPSTPPVIFSMHVVHLSVAGLYFTFWQIRNPPVSPKLNPEHRHIMSNGRITASHTKIKSAIAN